MAPILMVPEAVTKSTLKQYRRSSAVTDLVELPDRGQVEPVQVDLATRTGPADLVGAAHEHGRSTS